MIHIRRSDDYSIVESIEIPYRIDQARLERLLVNLECSLAPNMFVDDSEVVPGD